MLQFSGCRRLKYGLPVRLREREVLPTPAVAGYAQAGALWRSPLVRPASRQPIPNPKSPMIQPCHPVTGRQLFRTPGWGTADFSRAGSR